MMSGDPTAFAWLDPTHPFGFAAAIVVKASLLLLLTGAVARMLSRGTASARHLLWTLGIGGAFALPLVSLALPWSWPILPAPGAEVAPGARLAEGAGAATIDPAGTAVAPFGADGPDGAAPLGTQPAAGEGHVAVGSAHAATDPAIDPATDPAAGRTDAVPGVTHRPSASRAPVEERGFPTALVLALAWGLGAGLLLLHQVAGRVALSLLARGATPVRPREGARVFDALVGELGITRPVRLLVSDRTRVPMTWGLLRPVILLPRDAASWSEERLRLVLRHELAHVRRLDAFTHALGRVVCALYWFNPLAWWAEDRLRSESELASDDEVLSRGERASTYAGHLLELVSTTVPGAAPVGALPLAQRSRFEGRLLAILEPARARQGVGAGTAAALSTLGALTVVLLAAVAPAGAAETDGGDPGPADTPAASAAEPTDPVRASEPSARLSLRRAPEAAPDRVTDVADVSPPPALPAPETLPSAPSPRAWSFDAKAVAAQVRSGQELDPRAVAALVRALREDENPRVRETSAWALGQIEDRAATPALGEALRTDAVAAVRRTAAWALGQIEDPAAAPALGAALSDDDVEVRRTALWALGQIEAPEAVEPLSRALSDPDPEVRKTAAWGLGQIESREAVAPLTRALADADPEVREQAVWALGQIEAEESVEALVALTDDESPAVRRQAAWALGQIESTAAVEGLSVMLRGDAEASVREQAAWALGQIEASAALPALATALSDADPEVVTRAAWAIGQIEPDRAPPELLELARTGSGEPRQTALWALSQIEDPAAVPILVEALASPDTEVRERALRALSQIRDVTAVEAIAALLQDPSPEVREAAARALAGGGRRSPQPNPQPRPQPKPQPRPRPNGG